MNNKEYKMNEVQHNRFLRINEVLHRVPISRATWYQGVKNGIYPAQIRLGRRTAVWREDEIDALIERISAESREK
jgi:prophage regulatory protein